MKIGEFVIDLFVDAAKGELTIGNLVKSMGALEVASVGQIAILAALADKLRDITVASINSALGFGEYSAATGASTTELQKWQAAAAHVGVSNEDIAASLGAISQGLAGLPFGKSTPLLNLLEPLHLSLAEFKNFKPEELLSKIRTNKFFQDMDAATQKLVLMEAGLGKMQRLLTKGEGGISDKAFMQFQKDAGAMTTDQIHKWEKIHSAFVSVEQLSVRIGRAVAEWFSGPTFSFLMKEIQALREIADFLEEQKNFGATVKTLAPAVKEVAGESLLKSGGNPGLFLANLFTGGDLTRALGAMQPAAAGVPGQFMVPPASRSTVVHQTNNMRIDAKDPRAAAQEIDHAIRLGIATNDGTEVR